MASKRLHQDLFSKLPRELCIDILSRLPFPSTIHCKLVCKEWSELVKSKDFLQFHHSREKPRLLVLREATGHSQIFEFDDENWRENVVMNFKLNSVEIHCSVNGLILLGNIFICNPTTQQILRLPSPPKAEYVGQFVMNWGFGVSRKGGQYKIVRTVVCGVERPSPPPPAFYQVYTLGTGSWRSFNLEDQENISALVTKSICAFANGNLHWMEHGLDSRLRICRFDLETEAFTPLSPPPRLYGQGRRTLTALGGRLCLCDNTATAELVIWILNEEAWTKEYVVAKSGVQNRPLVFPIKVFEDGEMILIGEGCWGYQYSCYNNAKATFKYCRPVHLFCFHPFNAIFYTPSFLPLKSKVNEEELTSF